MKERSSNIAAAILAGGKNSRMGGFNKAFIRINGIPVIEIALAVLKRTFKEIIIVTNSPRDFKLYEKEAVITEDLIKDAGPLAGIHSALSRTSKQAVFFVACDMPFLHNGLIRSMVERFSRTRPEALVPMINALIEPLHAIYKTNLKNKLADYLSCRGTACRAPTGSYSVKSFLETINTQYLDLPDSPACRRTFKNLNTPQDLKGGSFASQIKSLAGERRGAGFWLRKVAYLKGHP